MKAGDMIWYIQTTKGGYGFDGDVPGEYVRATQRRVFVRLMLLDGSTRTVAVSPTRVQRRRAVEGIAR